MNPVGQHAAGRELLRAGDHDAVVALLHHAGVERRIALLVRGLAAVDLRRHDRVAEVEMVVAHEFIECDDVVGILLAAGREHAWHRRVAAEEARDVVGRAPHQAEGRLRPFLLEQPPGAKIGVGLRDLIGAQHRRAGLGRGKRHQLAVGRLRRDVVEPGDRARGLAKRLVLRDIRDLLAVEEDMPPVVERAQVFLAGAQRLGHVASSKIARLLATLCGYLVLVNPENCYQSGAQVPHDPFANPKPPIVPCRGEAASSWRRPPLPCRPCWSPAATCRSARRFI